MSIEAISNLYKEMLVDKDLQRELLSVPTEEFAAKFVEIGKTRGYEMTEDEVTSLLVASTDTMELDEAELDQVSGGMCVALVLCIPTTAGSITNMGFNLNKINQQFAPQLPFGQKWSWG